MSIFFMPNMAFMARCARSWSGSFSISAMPPGATCQDRPYLSFSQPHGPSSPPSESLVPVVVDLVLVGAVDQQRDGLAEGELGTAVDRDVLLAVELELDRQHGAGRSRAGLVVVGDVLDLRVREHRAVELGGVLALGVEPEVGGDLGHGLLPETGSLPVAASVPLKTVAPLGTHRYSGTRFGSPSGMRSGSPYGGGFRPGRGNDGDGGDDGDSDGDGDGDAGRSRTAPGCGPALASGLTSTRK